MNITIFDKSMPFQINDMQQTRQIHLRSVQNNFLK